jgi:uncharacterized protein (TIGR02231 family)
MRTLALLALLAPALAQDARPSIESQAPIRKVTVYLDRALVSRTGEAAVKRGESDLVVRELPPALLDSSVRARVRGAKLLSTEVKRYSITREQIPQEQVKKLQADIKKLDDDIKALDDELAALASEREFVASLKAATARDIAERIPREKVNPADWKDIAKFIRESLTENSARVRETQEKRRALHEKRVALASDLARLGAAQVLDRKLVALTVEADADGPAQIEISYVVPAALWSPLYDARIEHSKEDESVELIYSGQVVQNTGEDWTNVEVELSTSLPARSNDIPELRPLLVSEGGHPNQAPQSYAAWQQEFRGNFKQQKQMSQMNLAKTRMPNKAELDQNDMELEQMACNIESIMLATMRQHVSMYTFRMQKRETVPSDGAPHKVTLAVAKYPAKFERIGFPRVGPFCYVKGTLKNDKDFPLLPGTLNLLVQNNFVGTSTIKAIAPNESFELSVGVDDGVKLTRKLEEKREEMGALRKVHYHFTIKATNLKNEKVKLSIYDLIPVSQESDIEVMLMEGTTRHASLDKEGKIQWVVELDKGQSTEIALKYRVYHPVGKPIQGLE